MQENENRILILGSTGSIGCSAEEVLRHAPGKFVVDGLAAGRATEKLFEQIKEFRPCSVAVRDEQQLAVLSEFKRDNSEFEGLEIMCGPEGLERLVATSRAGKVLNAVTGAAGIVPSIATVESGRSLLLANKEALVAAGAIIMKTAAQNDTKVLPVDSEHSAIFQCLQGERAKSVKRILLTASGGPFFKGMPAGGVTPAMALNHPRWSMGPKVTIDSATLMNKGLEIIEAMWLFDTPVEKIKVVIHPECIIHSMVEFTDGVTMAQLSTPSMKLPIQYALNYPERAESASVPAADFAEIEKLNFFDPDMKRFPCLEIAIESARTGGLLPAMVSAADEVAVEMFLKEKISFEKIPTVLETVLERGRDKGLNAEEVTVEAIKEADAHAREIARETAQKFVMKPVKEISVKNEIVKADPPRKAVVKEVLKPMKKNERMEFLKQHRDALPKHVAIIMDGNGRWATKRGLPRTAGHKAGANRVEPILNLCRELGIDVLTLFAFSTENWQRPDEEVNRIMALLNNFIDRETDRLKRNKVRLCFPGSEYRLSAELKQKMDRATEITSVDYEHTLNICVNYGGRDEILTAVRNLLKKNAGELPAPDKIDEKTFAECLYTTDLPDPDILIRTGGDNRISNFLLWQIAYAEIFFHPKFWPDFHPDDLAECLVEFISRERRFGVIKEEEQQKLLTGIKSPEDLKKLPAGSLDKLAGEIRDVIISKVSESGGHLASNLGIVELSIALHRVFDSPRDSLVWDVGHQCYPHKLLTGRYDDFDTFRQRGGVSGFPNRAESEHDCFNTGHGSTSLSSALGMAAGRDLAGENTHVVGICGDGAMTGGMFLEALNHAGELGKNVIMVLNDNSFSISPATGAIARSLSRLRTNSAYVRFHNKMEHLKESESKFFKAASFVTAPVRSLGKYMAFKKGIMFEELGFKYVGPVDGHNIAELISVLNKAKDMKGPVLLHVLTQKGKGYSPAESDPASYHGVKKLTAENEKKLDIRPAITYTSAFSAALEKICDSDERVVGITAAMPSGTGLQKLMEKYPDRFFDVGMAEQHAVTFAAGLAAQGRRPVVAIYSTFLQRAYDQIFHDVCLQNLPVVFAVDRAGLVSSYGQTHQGILDISYLRNLPNLTVLAPRDTLELEAMLQYSFTRDNPVAIRYPSDTDCAAVKAGARTPLEHATAEVLAEGTDVAIWAVGPMAMEALKAGKILRRQGISAKVINTRFVRPMDEATLLKMYDSGIRKFVTVEDNLLSGGFGSLFLETINRHALDVEPVIQIGVDTSFIPGDSRAHLKKDFGLDGESIAARICERFNVGEPGTVKAET